AAARQIQQARTRRDSMEADLCRGDTRGAASYNSHAAANIAASSHAAIQALHGVHSFPPAVSPSMLKCAIIPVTPFQQNCSLVWCDETKQAAFVDPGGDVERLKDAARQREVTVVKVMLTHGHLDHAS